jgi:hypothetical protein
MMAKRDLVVASKNAAAAAAASYGAKRATVNGKRYERWINGICSKYASPHLQNEKIPLSTMSSDDLGGCSSAKHDLHLNWRKPSDVTIEIKVHTAPDWIQAALAPCSRAPVGWVVKDGAKNAEMNEVFSRYVAAENKKVFTGGVPPFLARTTIQRMTRKEWDAVKTGFADVYYDIDDDTIAKAYAAKGVQYIQISKYGLYHCVEDVCGLGTVPFICQQHLRVRCKRHGKKCPETGQHVPSTVTSSLRPNLRNLAKSPVSLEKPVDFSTSIV